MLIREQIRDVAIQTVHEHGMQLVRELKKHDNLDGGNLVALMEIFGAKVADAAARSVEGPDGPRGMTPCGIAGRNVGAERQ